MTDSGLTQITTSFSETYYPKTLELVQLQIIHRHGPRTPLNYRLPHFYGFSWPFCSRRSESIRHNGINILAIADETLLVNVEGLSIGAPNKSECLLGELTDHGRQVMTELGTALRQHYFEKLGLEIPLDSLHLRSTNYSRTIESLHSLLRGLFFNIRNVGHAASPLSIFVRDEYIEDMYGSNQCQKYKLLLNKFSTRFGSENRERAEKLKTSLPHIFAIPDLYGLKPSIYGLYDTLSTRKEHGLSLPSGVDASKMAELERLSAGEWFGMFHNSPETIRFGIGRFIREIHSNIFRKDRRLCIYSGHDSTIAPLLSAFKFPDPKEEIENFVPFAANIAIEQFAEKTPTASDPKHYVRVLYNGSPIIIPKCASSGNHYQSEKSLCTLETFSEFISQFIPKNYLKECLQT